MVKMETDTLNNYEQAQDKHVLDDSMDINIPRNDERTELHQTKEINAVTPELRLKDGISDNTESRKIICESSENKENENDCDQLITNDEENHVENEINNEKDSDTEDEKEDNEKETIESEDGNRTDDRLNDDPCLDNIVDANSHSDEEGKSLDEKENDPLNVDEEAVSVEKDISDTEQTNVEKDPLDDTDIQKDPLDSAPNSPEKTSSEKSKEEVNSLSNSPISEDNNKSEDITGKEITDQTKDEDNENKATDQTKDEDNENKATDQTKDEDNENKGTDQTKDVNDENKGTDQTKDVGDENKTNSIKIQDENKDSSEKDKNVDCPLLKETLTKPRSDDSEQQKEAEGMEDIDMDDDFDPSLLCPDIAMEVEEAPVITPNDLPPTDGNKSPLLYEPVFSTYVDEMTGAEVSFNLTAEEQRLRQESYGEENPVQYSRVHCTACNVHLGSALDGQSNRFVHPLLKVLICKDCYHFYTSGEFEKDEDGSELYCRWCGQGGQVICCSSCEMVFCKKCIRINFGRKKLTEIRDSDEWMCFRCDSSQLTALRVHCAEFMEYVRREISRAATLENATSFMTTDYTQCCVSQKKKYVEPHPSEPKVKKKRKSSNDPDYDPMRDRSISPQPSTSTATVEAPPQKLVPILPKPVDPNQTPVVVTQAGQNNAMFRVGNTTFRPRSSQFSQPRPRVQVINPTSPGVRPQSSGPGYIKIMPGGIRVPPTSTRNQSPQSFVSPSTRQPSFQHRPIRPSGGTNNQMKHEWFEKTVRAAARVNSNLSYTLTQLNRAQASATSVEALAVVHNKLQEILSTSINSLIQIRKNLRTEFIAGIKNIRFPPKPQPQPQPQPSTSTQDDDVIFVSPTPSPVPPPLLPTTPSNSVSQLTSINLPPSVSLMKRPPQPSTSVLNVVPQPSTSTSNEKPKVFLRVKSLTALQNVPSECITIPDDPLPPPPPLTLIQKPPEVMIIDNSPEKKDERNGKVVEVMDITSTAKGVSENNSEINHTEDKELTSYSTNGNKADQISHIRVEESKKVKDVENERSEEIGNSKTEQDKGSFSFDVKNAPTLELKKMSNVKILIKRSEEVDMMVKQFFGLVNGDTSE